MKLWINEREVPTELLELLVVNDLPNELRIEIEKAKNEVKNYGAVAYTTKARIEYFVNKYRAYLETVTRNEETKNA